MVPATTTSGVEVKQFQAPFATADADSSHPARGVRGASNCVTSARVHPRSGAIRAAAVLHEPGPPSAAEHAFATAGVATTMLLERPVTELRVIAEVEIGLFTVHADASAPDAACACEAPPAPACACISPVITCWSPSGKRQTRALELRAPDGPQNRPAGPARVTTTLRTEADSPLGPGRISVGVTAGAHVRRQCLCGRIIPGSGSASAEVAAVVRSISVGLGPV